MFPSLSEVPIIVLTKFAKNHRQYAAVTADTLSSELGILSTAPPRLILSLDLRPVPRGTNGGVTVKGLIAGAMGAGVIGAASCALLSECPLAGEQEGIASKLCTYAAWTSIAAVWGTLGSLLDSVLGATLQASVVDVQSGKVIEGQSGKKVCRRTFFFFSFLGLLICVFHWY